MEVLAWSFNKKQANPIPPLGPFRRRSDVLVRYFRLDPFEINISEQLPTHCGFERSCS